MISTAARGAGVAMLAVGAGGFDARRALSIIVRIFALAVAPAVMGPGSTLITQPAPGQRVKGAAGLPPKSGQRTQHRCG
ncbi:MAG: hypothetical protein EA339_12200 [Rhodobacteraceae bacterium]|nr:MAG: hypothetical protein EA339_12200 [Paracoccaceae bacterium]